MRSPPPAPPPLGLPDSALPYYSAALLILPLCALLFLCGGATKSTAAARGAATSDAKSKDGKSISGSKSFSGGVDPQAKGAPASRAKTPASGAKSAQKSLLATTARPHTPLAPSRSRKTKSSGAAAAAAAAAPAAAAAAAPDARPAWAAHLVETQTTKTVSVEFVDNLIKYTAPDRTSISWEANLAKNRYQNDIPCYDQERVILGKWAHDYINANYMPAPDGIKYIATQGPMLETRSDFWHMVVQEEAKIVLQLCKFVEADTEKCAEYWPAEVGATVTELDRFTIRKTGKGEEVAPGTIKHTLRIESKAAGGGVARTVEHLFCDAWPDQLAPTDTTAIVKLWSWVRANHGGAPVIVHCSAGVGRTATFIGISFGMEMLRKPGTSLVDVIKEMRKARHRAVQTFVQYAFLHVCLLEALIEARLIERNEKTAAFFDSFKKTLDKKLEKREKSDGGHSAERVTKTVTQDDLR